MTEFRGEDEVAFNAPNRRARASSSKITARKTDGQENPAQG
jgi:hypothetical protein